MYEVNLKSSCSCKQRIKRASSFSFLLCSMGRNGLHYHVKWWVRWFSKPAFIREWKTCKLITALDSNGFHLFAFTRKEEQIQKDEQFARALQEKLEQGDSTTPPETRGSELTSQSRDSQGSEQVRRGQVYTKNQFQHWLSVSFTVSNSMFFAPLQAKRKVTFMFTVNSRYSGHTRNRYLVSAKVKVRNSGVLWKKTLFQVLYRCSLLILSKIVFFVFEKSWSCHSGK